MKNPVLLITLIVGAVQTCIAAEGVDRFLPTPPVWFAPPSPPAPEGVPVNPAYIEIRAKSKARRAEVRSDNRATNADQRNVTGANTTTGVIVGPGAVVRGDVIVIGDPAK